MTANLEPRGFWRAPGPWMVAIGATLMFVNVARATTNPVDFATYLGLPLSSPADAGLVYIYALRALFIGILAAALLVRQNKQALALFALAAVVMPIGDAWLASSAGAPVGTIARHIGIAVFLLAAGLLLRRDGRREKPAK